VEVVIGDMIIVDINTTTTFAANPTTAAAAAAAATTTTTTTCPFIAIIPSQCVIECI
jgi:hypothetical protein